MNYSKLNICLFLPLFLLLVLSACEQTPQQTCTSYDTDLFIGNYNVSEFCMTGFGHGVTFGTVVPGNQENLILFQNFLNTGIQASAFIACTNDDQSIYFRIPDQTLGGSGFSVVGEGYYRNTGGFVQLQFDIQTIEANQVKNCSLTYSK